MLKSAPLKVLYIAGCLSSYLFSMNNQPSNFTQKSVWDSIRSCCAGQVALHGRSQLGESLENFRRDRTVQSFFIPNLPVINTQGSLRLTQVTLIKTGEDIEYLNAAISMMTMSEARK
jgi:hypothetical protein